MCPPEHFDVTLRDQPLDAAGCAGRSGAGDAAVGDARQTYESLGHSVSTIEPVAGLPDMVFAANGATVIDGERARRAVPHPERAAEAEAYLDWFRSNGWPSVHEAESRERGRGRHPRRRGRRDARRVRVPVRLRGAAEELAAVFGRGWCRCGWSTRASTTWTRRCACSTASTAMYYPAAFDDAGPGGPGLGVRRAHRGQGRGRRGARAERGLRRAPRGARRAGHRAGQVAVARAGFRPSRWTCPNCSRPAAARSAARWNCGERRTCT